MDEDDALRKRVRDLGPQKVATKAKIAASTLSMWLNDDTRDMRGKNKTALIAAVRALSSEDAEPVKAFGEVHSPIAVYDVRASAGAGALVEEGEPVSHQMFPETWVKSVTRARLSDLALIHVSGDSMDPMLRHGDQILVDRSVRRVVKDGIYVLVLEGELLVKRCSRDLADKAVIMSSDNKEYPTQRIKADQMLAVVGLVVWFARVIA